MPGANVGALAAPRGAAPDASGSGHAFDAADLGPDPGQFTVSRHSTLGDLNVLYSVSGTSSAADYVETFSGSVTITDGSSVVTLDVTPVDDALVEPDETLTLTVLSDAAYNIGTPGGGTVTIVSDDLPTVTLNANDPDAAELGLDTGQFTVSRDSTLGIVRQT